MEAGDGGLAKRGGGGGGGEGVEEELYTFHMIYDTCLSAHIP